MIIQPNWDHSEILGGLFQYLNNININKIFIFYDFSHEDGNYINYFLNLNSKLKQKSIFLNKNQNKNLKSRKYDYLDNYFLLSDYIFLLDENYIEHIYNNRLFNKYLYKIILFQHYKKINNRVFVNLTRIFLGNVPYNRFKKKSKYKYLIPNYFIDKKFQLIKTKIKTYIIIGNIESKNIELLNNIINTNLDFKIYIINRKKYILPIELQKSNKIIYKNNLSTNELINLLKSCNYIITLFKNNSVYVKNRICGIISFAISYGIPIITDHDYINKTIINCIDKKLIYNNENDFYETFLYSYNQSYDEWINEHKNIINYRNKIIENNNTQYDILFNKKLLPDYYFIYNIDFFDSTKTNKPVPIVYYKNKLFKSKFLYCKEIEKKYNIFNNNINQNKQTIKINSAFLYSKRFDYNWRHFLTETFFCVKKYLKEKEIDKELKLIILSDMPKYIIEVLIILDITDYIILQKNSVIITDKLIIEESNFDLDFLNFFIKKCKIKSNIKLNDNMKKIYISRKYVDISKKRAVINIKQFYEQIICNKYFEIFPEELNLWDQIVIINNADIILNLIGANCDNIIFINKNCKFYILFPSNCKKWAQVYIQNNYKPILLLCGNKIGKSTVGDIYNYPWKINIDKINNIINNI